MQLGFRDVVRNRSSRRSRKVGRVRHRHHARVPLGHNDAVLVNGIAGIRRDHGVARAYDGEQQVGEGVLGADGDDRFLVRVEFHTVVALVAVGDLLAQPADAARHRVAVIARVACGLDELVDDGRGVAPSGLPIPRSITSILGGARSRFHLVDDGEDVGRQLLNAIKLVCAFRALRPFYDGRCPAGWGRRDSLRR